MDGTGRLQHRAGAMPLTRNNIRRMYYYKIVAVFGTIFLLSVRCFGSPEDDDYSHHDDNIIMMHIIG
jgi:hypothetical protein